jgi:hypothetical protein
MNRWPSLLIVAGSAVLMQLHAIQFWIGHVGAAGVAWSLILEAVALWLWWQRRRALAVLASALLIAGPFHQLSAPTVEALRTAQASAAMLVMERAEVAQLEASLGRYQANSAERLGWAERIDRAQSALDAARERMRHRLAAQAAGADWRELGVIGLQALALLVVMVTQVLAVGQLRPAGTAAQQPSPRPAITMPSKISRPTNTVQDAPTPAGPLSWPMSSHYCPKHTTGAGPCYCSGSINHTAATSAETLAQRVAAAIEEDTETRNETQRAAAQRLGVRPADISMIRNHAARRNDGKETVSHAVLHRLANHYNIEQGSRNA